VQDKQPSVQDTVQDKCPENRINKGTVQDRQDNNSKILPLFDIYCSALPLFKKEK